MNRQVWGCFGFVFASVWSEHRYEPYTLYWLICNVFSKLASVLQTWHKARHYISPKDVLFIFIIDVDHDCR